MTQDNLTDPTLPDAPHVSAADGEAAVAETLTLAELNQFLGKDFKDKATALKSVKDTFSFVGKKVDIPPAVPVQVQDPALVAKVQSLEEEVWYANHPEYLASRDVIKAFGKSPSEVVEMEAFKTLFEKVKVADEVAKTRNIAPSNARLAQTQSTTTEAVKTANARGSTNEDVATVLARGILEEMGER